jgi:putative endonuclease
MLAWLKDVWHRFAPSGNAPAADEAGAKGEQAAVNFLKQRHAFTIVARNWRRPQDRRDEIDIVARDGEVLVFVEVKARGADALVPGYYTIDERKKRAVGRAVHAYLSALKDAPRTFRFDVVEVSLRPHLPPQCLHFENVPLFPQGYHVARQSGSLPPMPREERRAG